MYFLCGDEIITMANEKRLIDANALLRHKRKMSGADFGGEFWDEAVLASDIKNAPTVDAVEVVRCRDCLYSTERYGHLKCINGVSYRNTWNKPDFFCANGERKDSEENG